MLKLRCALQQSMPALARPSPAAQAQARADACARAYLAHVRAGAWRSAEALARAGDDWATLAARLRALGG